MKRLNKAFASLGNALPAMMVACLVVCLAAGCRPHKAEDGRDTTARRVFAPRDKHAPYDGIDISSHQGMIDWARVAQDKNIRFVFIKATEGATYESPHYGYNVETARKLGLAVGSYHYFTTTASVSSQVDNFTRLAPRSSQDLVPMIDVETRGDWSRRQLVDSIAFMARLLERHYGRPPIIYSTTTFYNDNLAPAFNDYQLYLGRYSENEPAVDWNGRYAIWQFSQSGVVPGIDAYVDLCRFADDTWLDDIAL